MDRHIRPLTHDTEAGPVPAQTDPGTGTGGGGGGYLVLISPLAYAFAKFDMVIGSLVAYAPYKGGVY
jgi:hypothetical protein